MVRLEVWQCTLQILAVHHRASQSFSCFTMVSLTVKRGENYFLRVSWNFYRGKNHLSFNVRKFRKYYFIFRIKFAPVSLFSRNFLPAGCWTTEEPVGRYTDNSVAKSTHFMTQSRLFAITDDYYSCKFAPVNLSYLGKRSDLSAWRRLYTAHFVGQIALMYYGCIAGDWPAIRRVNPLTCIKFVEAMSRNVFGGEPRWERVCARNSGVCTRLYVTRALFSFISGLLSLAFPPSLLKSPCHTRWPRESSSYAIIRFRFRQNCTGRRARLWRASPVIEHNWKYVSLFRITPNRPRRERRTGGDVH